MSFVYKYELIVADVQEKIKNGKLSQGDQLPSFAEMRDQYNASYGSIRTAVIILKTLGIVEGRHGVGVFLK